MLTRVVTGQYCSVHQLLFVSSLQAWLFVSPVHIAQTYGDAMRVVEAPCPRCLALTQSALHRQFPALYGLAAAGCSVYKPNTLDL